MANYISVLEFQGGSDSARIQAAVNAASKEGVAVLIPANGGSANGVWEIDKAIELPSNTHILLDGAHLRLKEDVFDNVFRSANLYKDKTEELTNIVITGRNGATIDGGKHNGLTEYNHSREGRPHIYCNNLILLFNVTHYEISNLDCINPRYWTINQVYCSYGTVKNIRFLADGLTPNQDGVNLRLGCHHITVENISGRTGDDTVALTGVFPLPEYVLPTKDENIHHVVIRNVKSTTHQTIVALRVSDGIKLHDILVDGVESLYDENDPETFLPWGTVRVGESLYYRHRPSIEGEIYDITVRNVKANSKYGVALANGICDSVFENITAVGKCPSAIMTDVKWWLRYADEGGGVTLERCLFKNIFYLPDSTEPRKVGYYEEPLPPAVFLFQNMKKQHYLDNVTLDSVTTKEGIPLLVLAKETKVRDIHISNIR